MDERRITFTSGTLTLEGLLAIPAGGPVRGGVVCHPHPLYGGTMYNNVVEAVLEAMWRLGWATLRFNFRGVGTSEGEHGGGAGEADDARAALEFLSSQAGVRPEGAILAGYSFGAMACARAAARISQLGGLVLVALPLRMSNKAELTALSQPIILMAGDRDMYCPAAELKALREELTRAQVGIIAGADHFFAGYEAELTDHLIAMMTAWR
ncbi:MAG: alpha/beta hydrolase [Candidatus Binataceae bacterium]